jgi:drug/metabolite transporter (DMT)-like permease
VLVIIRPGLAGFSVYSVYVVGSVAACVVRDLITRRLGGEIPALFISFVTALFVTLTGAAMAPFAEWQPVTLTHVGLMTGSALFLLMGYYFVVVSMRVGDIGFVSPFRYSVLLFSILGGILVYGEIPDAMTGLGAAIVVATGVYTLYRERIVARRPIAQLPTRP